MPLSTFITGADRGLGFAMTQAFLALGWRVLAGQYLPGWPDLARLAAQYPHRLILLPLDVSDDGSVRAATQAAAQTVDCIDLLLNNAGVTSPATRRTIQEPQDYADMRRIYQVNALGPLRVVEAFLPLVARSRMKRLGFVSSEASSVERSERTAGFGYCMSKSALNMAVKILFNHLRPQGYTFRLYHPGWLQSYMSGKKNLEATLELSDAAARAVPFFVDPRPDEDRLVLVDYEGKEWPW